jgi:amino-acid N-acetyltransferase
MPSSPQQYVDWFRQSSPYIHSHRGRTFVILISGETIEHAGFAHLIHDIALLNSLGVRLVLVHGARPQIENHLNTSGLKSTFEQGWRITSNEVLPCVEQAVGQVRVNIEAKLSMGLINTPMSGASLRVVSGNFVTARPYGIRNGVDFGHTGNVRRIDCDAIQQQLQHNNIVLISPLAYSPTGEAFNCRAEDVATATATALNADKLIFMMDSAGVNNKKGELITQLSLLQAEQLLQKNNSDAITQLHLSSAVNACKHGVRRAHLISHNIDGALLLELYTRDGTGTLISTENYEDIRLADIDDVGGILELIKPLEDNGALARRSRDQLELEISQFTVIKRDGMIIACAALYPYAKNIAELACMAVHDDYQNQGRATELLHHLQIQCANKGIEKLFILTTQTAHWFQEHGFTADEMKNLPVARKQMYNNQRNSRVFSKTLLDN